LGRCAPPLLALLLAAGCSGAPIRAASPNADAVRTQAQSPFFGLLSNTDPHAVRLDVRALPCSNAVRDHCVLIATVIDAQGKPLRGKRIEWTLEGVGQVLDADTRGGLLTSRGKLEKQYAVTTTGRSAQRVPRNTGRPEDDVVLETGETWCMITSAVEGESHLTVYAPDVADLQANRVVVTQRWFDTAYTPPPKQGGRPGDRVPLLTRVFRRADNQPLPGCWVRYRYLDGPAVLLLPTGSTEALVASDSAGVATSAVYQPSPLGGKTRLSVEVLRPDPRAPTSPPLVVGRGETAVDWQAPVIALAHTGPITVPVEKEATFTIAVRNNAAAATPAYTVRAALPDGADLVRSDPPAIREGNVLIWTLGELPGATTRELRFGVQCHRVGSLTSRASVVTAEGLRDEQTVTADVVPPPAPKLEAILTAPPAALVAAGGTGVGPLPIACQVTVRNAGTAPATNVMLSAVFRPDVLDHESKKNPVEIPVGTLKPDEARSVSLTLTPRGPGESPIGVTVRADGGLHTKADCALKVIEAGAVLQLTGPASRHVGRPAEWSLAVKNTGQVPLQQVMVRDLLPPELQFVEAPRGADGPEGRPNGGEVVWDVGVLRPNEVRVLKLVTKGTRPAAKVVHSAFVSAQAVTGQPAADAAGWLVHAKAEAALTLQGVASLNLKVADKVDPVHVGERTAYTIRVTNAGSLDGERVQVVATIPPEMRVVTVWGPGGYRLTGDRLEFQPAARLQPGAVLDYAIDVETLKTGDARLRVELSSAALKQPVVQEESTMVR
jgi:uncharacterized repeat protein (TIGR01451 family)